MATDKTPRDLLRVIFRRKALFLLTSSAFMIAALLAARLISPRYTGTTVLELSVDLIGGELGRRTSVSPEAIKLTLKEDLTGPAAVLEAASELNLLADLPRNRDGTLTDAALARQQDLVEQLQRCIDMSFSASSEQVTRVKLNLTHRSPELAQQLPNLLMRRYINRTRDRVVSRLQGNLSDLKKRLEECDEQARELAAEKAEFEEKQPLGVPPENVWILNERIQQVTADLDSCRRQRDTAAQKLARLVGMHAGTTQPSSQPSELHTMPNPELKRLQEELRVVENALLDAQQIFGKKDEHPDVVAMKKKVEQLRQRITETDEEVVERKVFGASGVDSVRANLEIQIAAATAEADTAANELIRLEKQLEGYRQMLANFWENREKYQAILKRIDEQEAQTSKWRATFSEVQMAYTAEAMNRRIHLDAIQKAPQQFKPSFPRLWTILALAIGGGLVCGGGLVFAANSLERSFATSEEAAKFLAMPVQGIIGEIVTPRQVRRRRLRNWLGFPLLSLAILSAIALAGLNVVLWLEYPQSYFREWQASPAGFLYRHLLEPAGKLLGWQ